MRVVVDELNPGLVVVHFDAMDDLRQSWHCPRVTTVASGLLFLLDGGAARHRPGFSMLPMSFRLMVWSPNQVKVLVTYLHS